MSCLFFSISERRVSESFNVMFVSFFPILRGEFLRVSMSCLFLFSISERRVSESFNVMFVSFFHF